MIVLGIETSCDETAVAIVDSNKNILAHFLNSQIDIHQQYGGVVPEIAARNHLESIDMLVKQSLKVANLDLADINAYAATCGPGLIGGLLVGATIAKTIAMIKNKKFLAINHLAAHALLPRLTDNVKFPYLLLLMSGGHCQTVIVNSTVDFNLLGTTMDDAIGECLDKSAKMLGLGYPGGPIIEKYAVKGDPKKFKLPIPLQNNKDILYDFSFSGLKSAVFRLIANIANCSLQDKYDICASLQHVIAKFLSNRLTNAIYKSTQQAPITSVVVSGGVAANKFFANTLSQISQKFDLPFIAPPLELCTDNGVMIAWAGIEKLILGRSDDLSFTIRPRWSLEEIK